MRKVPFVVLLAFSISSTALPLSHYSNRTRAHPDNTAPADNYHNSPALPFSRTAQPVQTFTYRAVSRGFLAQEFPFQNGVVRFFKNDVNFYERSGGAGGGRGFTIIVIDPLTAELTQPPIHFDTWASRTTGTAINAMADFLNGLPNGVIVLIAVADDAGLNQFDSCTPLGFSWTENGIQALEALGARQIRNYCYRQSYALVCVKGEGQAREEQLGNAVEASVQISINVEPPCHTVSSIAPSEGPTGTEITIRGANLSDVSAVKFPNNLAAVFTVRSDTEITARVPAGALTGQITLSRPGCSDVQTGVFTVTIPCPSVNTISPSSGFTGTTVTIQGNNFNGVNQVVFFNNISATFTLNSSFQITATVPIGATTGPVRIVKDGCSDVLTSAFTVTAPVPCPNVTSINPASGPAGSRVTITGIRFSGVNAVKFSPNVSTTFTVDSDSRISAVVPGIATTGPITISKTDCNDTQTGIFTVTSLCPAVNNLSPTTGPVGSTVTITGSNLTGTTSVKFSGNVPAAFTINSDSQIVATVPKEALSGPITLTRAGCNDVQTSIFTVSPDTPETKIFGFNFSPFIGGQDPNLGSKVSKAQIKQRLKIIAPHVVWVRSFGTDNGLDKIGQLAHKLGLKVAVGVWLSRDLKANEKEIARIKKILRNDQADMVVVGSEVLLRGDLSESQLIDYINRVKQMAPSSVPVTTGEVYGVLLSHPNLVAAIDLVFVNIYQYWEGISIENTIDFLNNRYQQVVSAASGKPVWISETGWPSCGNQVGQAVPSPENASAYFSAFRAWANANQVSYFYFAAFDEEWKTIREGPQGACWGVWDKDGKLKPGMQLP